MGGQNYHFVVACLVVVLAAASPLVQGQILGLGGLNLASRVCCSPSGNCSPGAGGLANVTSVLRCLNPVTGVLTEVGRTISTANGSIVISVPVSQLLSINVLGLLSGVTGTTVPCVLTETFSLVNQAVCPAINVVNTVLVAIPTVVTTTLSSVTGLLTLLLKVVTLSVNLGVNA